MTDCSARPANLATFATTSRQLDVDPAEKHTALTLALGSFNRTNKWGSVNATGLVNNMRQLLDANGTDATWVAAVGEAFRAADGSGSVAYADTADVESRLNAKGITTTGRADIVVEPSVATGGLQTTGYANDPVSMASGNFIEVEIDLGFGATLADLQVRRTFNSLDDADGPFGRGWSSWASTRLVADSSGTWADWRGPDGQVARIALAEGTCPGFEGTVSVTADGMVADFPKEAMTWRFDALGRPTETTRGPGTGTRFSWDGQRLVGIDHVRGRRVAFEWNSDRIVAAVADDGRRVTYTYDDARHLVAVDGPLGPRRYEVSEDGLILSVTDGDGVVAAANTYDERGRVLTQRTEFGRLVRFHYRDDLVTLVDDDDAGPVNRYEHDRHGRLLKVVDGHGRATTRDYDARGRVVAVTDRNGATTRYEWDDHDRQTAIVEPDGNRIETVYDDLHRPVTVTRGPAVTRFTYTGADRTPTEIIDPTGAVTRHEVVDGLLVRAVDPDGVAVALGYDDEGRLISATDGAGGVRRYEWDATGQLAALVSPAGRRTTFVRDPAGRVVEQRLPGGGVWRLERSAAGRVLATVDPLGNRREFELGAHGRVVAAADELGAVSALRYDSFGNVLSRSLPDGGKWEYQYDSLMRVVATTDPAGATWLREHDAEGNLTGTITPEGVHRSLLVDGTGRTVEIHDGLTSARFEYDGLGRPVAQIRPDGTRASGTYDLAGRLTSITEPTGGTSRFHHSPAGRLLGVTGPEGGTTHYTYDDAGRLITATDADGGVRRLRYDLDHQVIRTTDPTGEVTRYAYDADGRITEVTAPDGGVRRYAYDLAGQLVSETGPTGATVGYRYDPAGRLVEVTDPNGGSTRLERDTQGRVIAEIDPLGATTRARFDEMGRVLERTDPLGRSTQFAYDPSGRLVRRLDPDGRRWRWTYDPSDRVAAWGVDAELEVTVTRDLLGRITHLADDQGNTVERSWDRDGNLVAETTTTAHGTVAMEWRYDRVGRRIGFAVDGRRTVVALDAAGRVRELLDPDAGPLTIQRDATGRPTTLAFADRVERRTWTAGRLAARAVTGPDGTTATTFERDAAGRITATATTAPTGAGSSLRAAYDPAGQLVKVDDPAGEHTYAYDRAGRLTTETGPDGTTRHTYDRAGQRLRTDGPAGTVTYEWDQVGRRVAETSDGHARTYRYDAAGRAAAIDTTTDGTERHRRFTYDPTGRLAAVDDTVLGWDPVGPYDSLRRVGDRHLIGAATPLATIGPDQQLSWLDTDHRGTPTSTDPWGLTGGPATGLPGGLGLGLGGELAVDDQLWLRARLYDPGSRSFTTPDPLPGVLGQPGVGNPYHFGANDPLNQLDPSGMRPITEAELDKIRSDWEKTAWDRYGNYVIAGAMVVGGVAIMATGVGGPIGAAMIGGALLSGGISAGTQQYTTGGVSWQKVGVDMALGAAGGGAGAWAAGAMKATSLVTKMGPLGQRAITETTENVVGGMADRGLNGQNPFNPKSLGLDVITGGAAPAAGSKVGKTNDDLATVEQAAARADDVVPPVDRVALDSSSARALTSIDQSVGQRLNAQLGDRQLVMSQTAADEYQSAVSRLAGTQEKEAAERLMARVTVVPDNPSDRVAALQITKKVGAADIQVFGTADRLNIPIATADLKFLRGAHAQGVTLDAIVHPPISFKGV